ncbi:MAG: ATP-binding cassette, subfamily bacterial CydCD [Microbacteriaceae bacterium]|nr:ATP-binding cassette, subfamily bacterial CydCD [Microbacteriaceae bacterium]
MSRGIRNSPFAGLDTIDRRTLYLLGLLSALKAFALIGMATAVTTGVVDAIAGRLDLLAVLPLGIGSALVRGVVSWMHRVVAARAVIGVKERLRSGLADHVLESGGSQGGSVATLATQGLDELDKYYTNYLPALVTAITVPIILGARILFADWVSALIVVITVPLIPVFMTLIGLHTRARVEEASSALGRLSDHLVELARGLPVLVGLGRAKEQVAALDGISERYRAKTVETLRTAFLSSLALELIATISVAVVAVFIGVRLVAGELPLEVGLLVLILAPECMAPFRDIGSAFHAAQDGRVALSAARAIIETPAAASVLTVDSASSGSAGGVRVRGLTVHFADRDRDTLHDLDLFARSGRITLIDGRSGAGKSTVLAVLAGRLRSSRVPAGSDSLDQSGPGAGSVMVSGSVAGIDPSRVAWLPQHPRTVADSVLEELLVYAGDSVHATKAAAATLDRFGLSHLADAHPASISPGELRRLAMARVLMRVDAGADVVLLDEPTAQLDAENARIVVDEIIALRLLATVIVASHDQAVRAIADTGIALGAPSRGVAPLHQDDTVDDRPNPLRAESVARSGASAALTAFLSPAKGRIIAAIALGTGAAVFAICLTGLSGWLIVRASQHPPIMYLLVAIVGVRFFGIGRAVLRYFERLVAHDAVFSAMTSLRTRLWSALAGTGIRDRSVLGSGATLDRLVRDVDQLRDLALRVVVPLCSGLLAVAITVTGMWILAPSSAPVMLTLGVITLVAAPAIAVVADRSAGRRQQRHGSLLLRRFSAIMSAAGDLRGNAVDGAVRQELELLDGQAGHTARRSAWALGLGGSLVVAACGCAAVVAILSAARGGVAPGMIAVMALVPLALVDPLLDYVAAVQLIPALREVLAGSAAAAPTRSNRVASARAPFAATSIERIEFDGLTARWLDSGHPVIDGVSGRVDRGEWLVVSGPSGSGKSTLLSVLLGHLDPLAGSYRINGQDTAGFDLAAVSARIGWCPQEGHLFDSTLRANLLIARGRDDAPDDDELESIIRLVGLGPLLDRLPLGLDTPVGPDAARLSGGERQRVAVARTLLTGADVILLDEPTAHLDDESADGLMADLRVALSDRIAVLVTHHAVGLSDSDARVRLGRDGDQVDGSAVLPTAQSDAGVGAAA